MINEYLSEYPSLLLFYCMFRISYLHPFPLRSGEFAHYMVYGKCPNRHGPTAVSVKKDIKQGQMF